MAISKVTLNGVTTITKGDGYLKFKPSINGKRDLKVDLYCDNEAYAGCTLEYFQEKFFSSNKYDSLIKLLNLPE